LAHTCHIDDDHGVLTLCTLALCPQQITDTRKLKKMKRSQFKLLEKR
jgi:hypothetical protein